jgi:hypothetical protein
MKVKYDNWENEICLPLEKYGAIGKDENMKHFA